MLTEPGFRISRYKGRGWGLGGFGGGFGVMGPWGVGALGIGGGGGWLRGWDIRLMSLCVRAAASAFSRCLACACIKVVLVFWELVAIERFRV